MDVKLVVVGGKQAGKEIPIGGPEFVIGRAEGCHLRPQSDAVSRRHCTIEVHAGSVTVRDLNSRNGTFINDEQIKSEHELKSGDRLKVGPLEFEVRLSVQVGGKSKPKVHTIQEAAARTVENAATGDRNVDISQWLNEETALDP
jgi:pSer/pThr/pTyr-binding forkhead associated (FHA) protein